MWKFLLFLVAMAASIVVLGLVIHSSSKPKAIYFEPIAQTQVSALGRMEGVTEEIYLGFLLPGKIKEIKVAEGDYVKTGDDLVILDNKEYHNKVLLAQANKSLYKAQLEILKNGAHKQEEDAASALMEAKKVEIEFNKSHYERLKGLLQKRATSIEQSDQAYTNLVSSMRQLDSLTAKWKLLTAPPREDMVIEAEARIHIAEAEINIALDVLDKTFLRAPIDGQIISLDAEPGEHVGNQPILVMADTSTFCIRAFVDEYDALRIKEGMTTTVTVDSSEELLYGKISRIGHRMTTKEIITNYPTEKMDTKVREVWIDLIKPNKKLLVIGLRVDVTINLFEEEIDF